VGADSGRPTRGSLSMSAPCTSRTTDGGTPPMKVEVQILLMLILVLVASLYADFADTVLKGAQMVIEEANVRGGVSGYTLEAIVLDSGPRCWSARPCAAWAIRVPRVAAGQEVRPGDDDWLSPVRRRQSGGGSDGSGDEQRGQGRRADRFRCSAGQEGALGKNSRPASVSVASAVKAVRIVVPADAGERIVRPPKHTSPATSARSRLSAPTNCQRTIPGRGQAGRAPPGPGAPWRTGRPCDRRWKRLKAWGPLASSRSISATGARTSAP